MRPPRRAALRYLGVYRDMKAAHGDPDSPVVIRFVAVSNQIRDVALSEDDVMDLAKEAVEWAHQLYIEKKNRE